MMNGNHAVCTVAIYHNGFKPITWLQATSSEFTKLLRVVSKKGFYSILKHLGDKSELRYHEILKAALGDKIVDSRSQVDVALRMMVKLGMLDRTIHDERPPATTYRLSKKGKDVLHYLRQLEARIE
jgi:DNA-binding HxlR family transcriptional regulator